MSAPLKKHHAPRRTIAQFIVAAVATVAILFGGTLPATAAPTTSAATTVTTTSLISSFKTPTPNTDFRIKKDVYNGTYTVWYYGVTAEDIVSIDIVFARSSGVTHTSAYFVQDNAGQGLADYNGTTAAAQAVGTTASGAKIYSNIVIWP
ncbi:MAG: hypothetical protein WAQ27_03650 [Candidatus Microsaccharimonas sp.]